MKFSREHNYSHSTDTVFALFTDAKEIKAKQKALDARKIRVDECERDAMVIDSSISFVGKTLAEFVAKDCERFVAREYEYISDRLAPG